MPAGTGVWVVKTVPARQTCEGLVEAEPLVGVLADALQAEEPGVALVGVEDLGRGVPAQRAEGPHRAHPADAEQQLLAQPVVAAAAVQPVGDLVQVGLVLLHVGVEQQQRHAADLGHPDLRGQLPARSQAHLTCTGAPEASRSSSRGRPFGSSDGYRSACQPSTDSDWVK